MAYVDGRRKAQLTPEQIRWFRLRRSGLVQPFADPLTAVSSLMGVQAQILPAAAVSLWNRTPGLTYGQFEDLLYRERALVKLWGQRNTLHLYASREWPFVHGGLSITPSWWERQIVKEGGDARDYRAKVRDLAELMRGQESFGRSELRRSGFELDDDSYSSWGGIFFDMVRGGYVCHAGRNGSEGRFAHRETWLPQLKWNPPPAEMANTEWLWRYLSAYGPALIQDFAYWRGARVSDAQRWLAALGESVREVVIDGRPHLILAHDLDPLFEAPPARRRWPVRLLYRFDPLLLGHKDKRWLVDEAFYNRVWRPAGHIEGVILEHGRIAGTWRYDRDKNGLKIAVFPFKKLAQRVQSAVRRNARAIARFFGLPLVEYQLLPPKTH